jgi:putative tryptophan/tyrosine transport system substrate-binding protein
MSRRMLFTVLVLAIAMAFPWNSHAGPKKIAVIWDGKSIMPNNVNSAFLPRLRQLAPDVQVEVHRQLKDMQEAERVFRDCEARVDGIVFLRSSGAEFLAKAKPRIPCFIGACNNPVDLGAVKDLNAPEGNITGVTYFIPYDKRFDIITALFPGVKSVGLLVERGHPSGPIEQKGTQQEATRRGFRYQEVVASDLTQLMEGTRKLAGTVDLLIVTNTRLVMDNTVSLLQISNPAKTPLFSYADTPVKSGAVAGLAADDFKLGSMLADSVFDVVVKGKLVSQVPVKMDPDPRISINDSIVRTLGLKFPDTIMKGADIVK